MLIKYQRKLDEIKNYFKENKSLGSLLKPMVKDFGNLITFLMVFLKQRYKLTLIIDPNLILPPSIDRQKAVYFFISSLAGKLL
jgi:hypothetical protein